MAWSLLEDFGSNYSEVSAQEIYEELLFVALMNTAGGDEGIDIWYYDGADWILDHQFKNGVLNFATALQSFNGDLYMTTKNAKIYIRVSGVWSEDKDFSIDYEDALCMKVHNNELYVGMAGITWLYGFFAGGDPSDSNIIEYIDVITTSGNALDKGDLILGRGGLAGNHGTTYGFFAGGYRSGYLNEIDYINVTTISGNALDKGDLTLARSRTSGNNGSTYGFFGGGNLGGGNETNVIEYINITTTSGNATNKGDLTVARAEPGSNNGSTYGFFGGGFDGGFSNVIDYIDLTNSTSNATDKGDLTIARRTLTGNNGRTYGFFAGGYNGGYSNIIDYIDLTSNTTNAIDKGDLTLARNGPAGNNGTTYGFFGGGGYGSFPADVTNIIDYIDLTSTYMNALDKGDLTVAREEMGANNG